MTGGSGAMGDPGLGSAEVRTGMHSGRGAGDEYAGLGLPERGGAQGVRDRVAEKARSVRDGAGSVAGTVRERAEHLGHRAGEAASEARNRIGALSDRTNQMLEERGLMARLRENPMPALAVAFGVGFLLAGGRRNADTPASRVRRELREAVMAGLTAGAAQATRGFLQSSGGMEGLLGSLAGGGRQQPATGRTERTGGARPSGTANRPPSHQESV